MYNQDFKIICIAPFAWGKGRTVTEAKKHCRKNIAWIYVKGDATMSTYFCHPDTHVTDMGGLSYPKDKPPFLIDTATIKRPRNK